jgi:hypothetical protein
MVKQRKNIPRKQFRVDYSVPQRYYLSIMGKKFLVVTSLLFLYSCGTNQESSTNQTYTDYQETQKASINDVYASQYKQYQLLKELEIKGKPSKNYSDIWVTYYFAPQFTSDSDLIYSMENNVKSTMKNATMLTALQSIEYGKPPYEFAYLSIENTYGWAVNIVEELPKGLLIAITQKCEFESCKSYMFYLENADGRPNAPYYDEAFMEYRGAYIGKGTDKYGVPKFELVKTIDISSLRMAITLEDYKKKQLVMDYLSNYSEGYNQYKLYTEKVLMNYEHELDTNLYDPIYAQKFLDLYWDSVLSLNKYRKERMIFYKIKHKELYVKLNEDQDYIAYNFLFAKAYKDIKTQRKIYEKQSKYIQDIAKVGKFNNPYIDNYKYTEY